jgi:cytochrome c oxidase cbb3-type subunit 3
MAKLLDHVIDGIEELDNPPPGWLMAVFYATIVFGIGYAIYYPSFWFWPGLSNWTSAGQYTAQLEQAEKDYAQFKKAAPEVSLSTETAVLELGAKQYRARCAACHGNDGEGRVGPSFLDDTWLYGGSDADLVESIKEGRPKGMPAWGKVLKPEEMVAVASFVRQLNSNAVSGGK